jgi:glycosyltransferase involved in cell wall biosynthesis
MTRVRLLAIIEAASLTGPAKNLLEFCRHARELDAVRIEPFLVTFRRGNARGTDDFLDAARLAGIPVEVVKESGPFDTSTVSSLRRIIGRINPDIIQTHAIKSHFLTRWSGLWKERPWVAFHHGYTLTDTKMLAYNLLDLWSLRAPARIVTVSSAFERQLTGRGISRDRITVVHNAVDVAWVERSGFSRESARQLLNIGPDEKIILSVGRLSREKAFVDLLAALDRMKASHPELPVHLYIAGEGPERLPLEERVSALGLGGCVKFTGAVRQLAPYYAAADVLAISSIQEGSPNALLEAMAAGLPVVATSVGGIPEIATHGESALLVAPGKPESLANGLAQMLLRPDQASQMAELARRIVVERFDPVVRANVLADIYGDIVHRTQCA